MTRNTTSQKTRKRILVVEDDPELVKLHRNFLSEYFNVVIETSGANALRRVKNNRDFHLAVIDMKLPDISGIEVLKEVKKNMPDVPVIVITAFGSEDVAVRAFRCGARDYVKKPFSFSELVERVNFCLSLNAANQPKRRSVLTNETEEFADVFLANAKKTRNRHIRQALRYIHDNYTAQLDLERVASAACLSKYYFSRLFKEATGMTLGSYVNRTRIKQARHLLADHDLSITNVGLSVGYSDLTHFERVFKKLVGVVPSQYRHQYSADETMLQRPH